MRNWIKIMGKTAFIFPGQGAQYCGMGKDFFDAFDTAKKVYVAAGEATGLDVGELCFTENDRLDVTEYTQIAMLATEVAILKVLEEKGLRADCTAGLSLGEYGALAAAGVMELPQLFWLIRCRGIYMQEAYPEGGAMSAVLGLDCRGWMLRKSAISAPGPKASSPLPTTTARARSSLPGRQGRCRQLPPACWKPGQSGAFP